MYDNPEDYVDEKKKQKKWCLKKALELAELKNTEQQPTDMDSSEIVKAAKNFESFLNS